MGQAAYQANVDVKSLLDGIDPEDDPRHALKVVNAEIAKIVERGGEVPAELSRVRATFEHECVCQSQGR